MTRMIIALSLLQFTSPTGSPIDVNIDAISSIRDPRNMSEGHWSKGTHCIIVMSNGKFIAIRETCNQVETLIKERTGSSETLKK